ncbi:MAG: DEAD/DEAH box helicase, partial [Acidimicrobiales bacterium]|nr:DEAD/DEAH box helicase [Acidimicrobiales bacterium]
AFYTTPLKALSNQKYQDLCRRHGSNRVGLLTGDNAIAGDAPVVVMTTEVLRNMIYAGSADLERLAYVVLDEVHYLQDPYRGAVWEEIIIHAPAHVLLVCLSATVSNAEEVAEWISTVRGHTTAVIEERRPVELRHLYLIGDRSSERAHLLPTFIDGRPNREASALDEQSQRPGAVARGRGGLRPRFYTPRRHEVVERLAEESMLPAIYFIFSRAGCDDAVRQCLHAGIRLTTPAERERIRRIAEAKVAALSDDDLSALGYGAWLEGMLAGIASHHAGLVPPFKEAVELCFAEALVKAVFATETLSLGINMPARSVVVERLTKFGGEHHEALTPGEYTQLAGRAGRRGIDQVGYAIVLWSVQARFSHVAGLASNRTYALRSSFRPTYNMAANLVGRYSRAQAHHLLSLSFAQYLADAELVGLRAHLERLRRQLAETEVQATCERGDVGEYLELERAAGGRPGLSRPFREPARGEVRTALQALRPGDVLAPRDLKGPARAQGPARTAPVAIVATSQRRGGTARLQAVAADARTLRLGPSDFARPPRPTGRLQLPAPYQPHSRAFLEETAAALRRLPREASGPAPRPGGDGDDRRAGEGGELARHPVAGCPDLAQHLRAARRAERLAAEARRAERHLNGHRDSLTRQLDAVLDLLSEWGYVRGWTLTESGRRLANLYHEADLLVAHSLELGLFDGLPAPELAGLGAAFTYEPRGPNEGGRAPERGLRQRWQQVESLSRELALAERKRRLVVTRPLDPGFMGTAEAWAKGDDLDRLLAADLTSGGDFVRNVKQLIDLLRQVEAVAPSSATAAAAAEAARRLFRGVIAASSIVEAPPASPDPASPDEDPSAPGTISSSAPGTIPPRPLGAQ